MKRFPVMSSVVVLGAAAIGCRNDAATARSDAGKDGAALDEAGCGAGVCVVEMGPPDTKNPTLGSGGGYGGIYCFALTP